MRSLYLREIKGFLSSIIGYVFILIYLISSGIMHWIAPTEANLLEGTEADLIPFFNSSPIIFLILIPAITMRSIAEERRTGTIELLFTRPISDLIHTYLSNLEGGVLEATLIVMFVIFLLGFILDFIEITFLVVPIVGPILLAMGLDPIWLGIMIAINLQTSFLTPPFGFALFYLRGVAPESVKTVDIYKGVIPFIIIQIGILIALWIWPSIATWLPNYLNP